MSNLITPVTREYLQSLPDKRRWEAIASAIQTLSSQVTQAASSGKTSSLVPIPVYCNSFVKSHPSQYIPNVYDLVEGFKLKFPDCHVEYTETWEEVRPGVKEQKKGILVDWS